MRVIHDGPTLMIFADDDASSPTASAILPAAIDDVAVAESTLVVLLSPDHGNRNVYGVSFDGAMVWQVPAATSPYDSSPYMAMQRDGDRVHLNNWGGVVVTVDAASGRVLGERYLR